MVKRGRVVAYVAGAVALAVVAGTLLFGGPGGSVLNAVGISPLLGADRTNFSESLDVVPQETERLSFTDWELVRTSLGSDVGASSSPADIESMIARAYDTDFSASSSIEDSAVALQKYFGFSPATMTWEAYAQTVDGAAMVVRMPDGFDYDRVRDNLSKIGFTKPGSKNGVWDGGIDLIAALDGTLTPKLQYVAVLADDRLIVTSESHEYVQRSVDVIRGKTKSLGESGPAREVVDGVEEPATAEFWVDDFACTDLSSKDIEGDDRAESEALVARAGKVSPLSGLVMSMSGDRTFTVSELFEDGDQAKANLAARAQLIVGPAPGIGGSFTDNLTLVSSKTEGATVQLVLKPTTETGFVLGALNHGPVLFATC